MRQVVLEYGSVADMLRKYARVTWYDHGFTEKETEFYVWLMEEYIALYDQGLREPFLSKEVNAPETRKKVMELHGISENYMNYLYRNIRAKGFLENGKIADKFIPSHVSFMFNPIADGQDS
jgi:hypothetical protein